MLQRLIDGLQPDESRNGDADTEDRNGNSQLVASPAPQTDELQRPPHRTILKSSAQYYAPDIPQSKSSTSP